MKKWFFQFRLFDSQKVSPWETKSIPRKNHMNPNKKPWFVFAYS